VRPHLALAAVACIWGLSYLGTKVALRDLGPFELAAVRTAIAAALFAPAFVRARHEIRVADGLVLGALGVALYYAAFNVGLGSARATDAGVIQAAIPAASALVAIPLLGERGTLRSWLGIALSTVGVVVLVAGTSAIGEGSLSGDLWIVATVVDWALYNVAIRRISRRASDTAITAAALVYGAALTLPLAAVELTQRSPTLSAEGAAAVLFLALFASALGYWLWSYGMSRVEAGRASTYLNLLPLVAVVSGALVLGERIGPVELAGGALILGGVALAGRG
jgi:drug/metabolite transporter (DMT)-like permease